MISYDHLKNSVELCQRFGRARSAESSIVVLDERLDRPLEILETVHALQEQIVQEYEPQPFNSSDNQLDEMRRQQSREQTACQTVLSNAEMRQDAASVTSLQLFVKKTKALFQEECRKHTPFYYTMSYSTVIRSISVVGSQATSKKEARKLCASKMLLALEEDIRRKPSQALIDQFLQEQHES